MTGRDLILYILQNNLENEEVFKDGRLIGFMTVPECAVKFGVGMETINVWVNIGVLKGYNIGDEFYIPVLPATEEML